MKVREDVDLPSCIAVLRAVHERDGYPSLWPADPLAWLTPPGFVRGWVALRGSEIVGHAALAIVDPRRDPQLAGAGPQASGALAEVQRLFVHPTFRRGGEAEALLDAAAAHAEWLGYAPLLEVTHDRLAAIRLYERSGWQRTASYPASWQRASGERPTVHRYQRRR